MHFQLPIVLRLFMREGAKSVRKGRFVMIIKASIAQLWKTIGTNMKDNMGQVVGANFAGS